MPNSTARSTSWRRPVGLSAAATAAVVAVLSQTPVDPSRADVAADRAAAAKVRAAITAEERRISATAGGLASAEARLATLTAREATRRDQFLRAQDRLVRERIRLTRVQKRSTQAKSLLGKTLAESYRRGQPDLATIVVSAGGLSDALDRVEYEQRVHRRNARVLEATRIARTDSIKQEASLSKQEQRFQALAAEAAKDRDAANAVRTALLRRQAAQLRRKNGARSRLATLQANIRRSEQAQIQAVRAQSNASEATAQAPKITGSSSADSVIARVVAAANQIATTPYVWGGGHGGAASGGYDCSGSVSYALAAGGLLSSPMTSGGFMSWGLPGPGQRITIYANGGHVYMVVDGRRYDTSALRAGGTRWTTAPRSNAGFVVRHPAGL
jgi:cell wall-associated NlpC family hydrolase